ncbi:carbon-nitrogen hydrolase family protein [Leucothrix mucor]|uniref:carbon-nitrogen hydrolase family protein n=1 Tax=Leucothrix mucor TaxID=45248 RepID=UPI0003B597CF|nr:carbon-nitrogen hydrolase family protein [Leucothrix mucor]
MSNLAIAGIQTHITTQNNIEHLKQKVELLMYIYPWTQMVVFSELAASGPIHATAEEMGGPYETACQEIALKHGVWLIPGSYFEKQGELVYNTAPVINPAGEIVTRYRKMFPFTPYEKGVTPGTEFCVFDVPDVGRIGLNICYDVWFPEINRTLTTMGAEVIISPVLAHFIDRDMDLVIAQANAAMFQTYMFHINGLGAGGNGRSLVVSPSGRILHQASVEEELIPIEVDFKKVRRQRERGLRNMGQPMKSFRDRPVDFPVYDRENFDATYLNSLGELKLPVRGE